MQQKSSQQLMHGRPGVTLRFARFLVLIIGILLINGLVFPAEVQADGIDRELCVHCRRFSDRSPARMEANVTRGEVPRTITVCSLFCLCRVLLDEPDLTMNYSFVLNYEQYGAEFPGKFRSDNAWYVFVPEFDTEHTHPPVLLAFRNQATATEQAELLDGKVLDWDTAFELVWELAEQVKAQDDEKEERERRPPLRYR